MEIKEILIPLDKKTTLAGMVLSHPDFSSKRPVILVIHGWTSSMANFPSRVESLVKMGYLVLLFDLRGHGKSGGTLGSLSPHDHLKDALAAYDYLLSLDNANRENISVIGYSYGGYLASMLSSKRKIDHLALAVPALYPNILFDRPKKLQRSDETSNYRKQFHRSEEDFALQAVHIFTGDLLLIRAEKDEILSATVMENYRAAAQVPYTYKEILGSDHSMHTPGANEERIKIQTEWFGQFIHN